AHCRDRKVRLLDAAEHLFIKSAAERLETLRHRGRVRVLRLQILADLRVGFFAQPEVFVDDGSSVAHLAMVEARRDWRRLRRYCHSEEESESDAGANSGHALKVLHLMHAAVQQC